MFGIKFSSMGSSDVFVPDEVPVDGQLIPEDSDRFKPCSGQIFGIGKSPDKVGIDNYNLRLCNNF
jgi:hypothetical protein